MTELFPNRPTAFTHAPAAEAMDRVPAGSWVTCRVCGQQQYAAAMGKYKVCTNCGYGFRLGAQERLGLTVDQFAEWDADIHVPAPHFPGYAEKLAQAQAQTGLKEAVITGIATIDGYRTAIGVMDAGFIMGSLGEKTGEKLARLFDAATDLKLPVILFTASGGARMQEGIKSLMQLAKVSAAIERHATAGLVYITVLTDPTMGGVTASFAMQGDITLAEPKTLIGFAGRRVIEQTIHEDLPKDFQRAEHVMSSGFLDEIVTRPAMHDYLANLLRLHGAPKAEEPADD
jgi:acetyl-CoA carboxylase carboxyl transferase subunit beta